jgi:LuxR family quorum-sensing system transcriptional regulator SolR
MHLANNHLFYTICPDIAEIAKPLKNMGITYFTYTRSYHDGSRIYLNDRPQLLNIYLKEKHYIYGNTEAKPAIYKEQVALWSTLPNQNVFNACARSHGVDHGVFMFHPRKDYCEVFAFATKSGNDKIINTYLSQMDALTKFKQIFLTKATPIIKNAEKHKITLPHNDRLNRLDLYSGLNDIDITDNKFLENLSLPEILSARQIECCKLLINGKSAKQIADSLGLSSRTVEFYLANIKSKLQCNNKIELVAKLLCLLSRP